jgi:L-2-hydroxyglutarate oxidase LhgO
MNDIELAIVGGGIVGMACAARLARAGLSVVLIEQHDQFGQEGTSRNSGVIHAGLYYETGSLKATTCVEGRRRLIARCQRDGVMYRQCGKLVVATEAAERPLLETLYARGTANEAGALRLVEASELRGLEPRVSALAALWSPDTRESPPGGVAIRCRAVPCHADRGAGTDCGRLPFAGPVTRWRTDEVDRAARRQRRRLGR